MISNLLDGVEYGTDVQVADRLTQRDPHTGRIIDCVTPAMVRRWHDRHGLTKVRMKGSNGRVQVVYPITEAALFCRVTADTPQGRRRQLDSGYIAA